MTETKQMLTTTDAAMTEISAEITEELNRIQSDIDSVAQKISQLQQGHNARGVTSMDAEFIGAKNQWRHLKQQSDLATQGIRRCLAAIAARTKGIWD